VILKELTYGSMLKESRLEQGWKLFGAEIHSNDVTSLNEADELLGEWLSLTPNAESDKVETESFQPTTRTC
jgi:hypothetical protein